MFPTMAKKLTTCLVGSVSGAGPTLRPGRTVFALPCEQGGMRLIQLPDIEAALQAKVVSRLFEPERLVWKAFAAMHLSRGVCRSTCSEFTGGWGLVIPGHQEDTRLGGLQSQIQGQNRSLSQARSSQTCGASLPHHGADSCGALLS